MKLSCYRTLSALRVQRACKWCKDFYFTKHSFLIWLADVNVFEEWCQDINKWCESIIIIYYYYWFILDLTSSYRRLMRESCSNYMREKSSKELKTSFFMFTEMFDQRSSDIIRHVVDIKSFRRRLFLKLSNALNEFSKSSAAVINSK
jgi:hypothetical protein